MDGLSKRVQVGFRLFVFLTFSANLLNAVNLDVSSARVFLAPQNGSYFGFSVDLHRDGKGIHWLLVGAPKADAKQPGVERGGAVYRCDPVDRTGQCILIPFDRKGNYRDPLTGLQMDEKSNQWFGATVRSAGPNSSLILACAPRYIWFTEKITHREPVGTCFVSRDTFREFNEYSPCRTATSFGYHRDGSCQAGLGAAVSKSGHNIFIGAVGSWYWHGQIHSINVTNPPNKIRSSIFQEFITGVIPKPKLRLQPEALTMGNTRYARDQFTYLGYSVAVGDLNGDGIFDDIAVGQPRAMENITGKVMLFTGKLARLGNITGQQFGAYFGYCVAITDLNNDGMDDVVVGAPLYTNYANMEGKYETGRVHVFYQSFHDSFQRSDVLDGGEVSKARFGLAVSALGDINLDGINDLAVGAPYDGPTGKGAVYIYHGSSKGIQTKASQVVYAEEISSELSTFGFSLAGGMDIDGNEYPDIVVGAYDSDRVVYIRSRPIIILNMIDISYGAETKNINLEEKNCWLSDSTAVTCIPISVCLMYSGRGVNAQEKIIAQIILDSKSPKNPRVYFMMDENKSSMNETFQLQKDRRLCRNYTVFVRPGISDKKTPIESKVICHVPIRPLESRARLGPSVLDGPTLTQSTSIGLWTSCGADHICIPDLQLSVNLSETELTIGSADQFEIEASVFNAGEDAFDTVLHLTLPVQVDFIRVENTMGSSKVSCQRPSNEFLVGTPEEEAVHQMMSCQIGNSLQSKRSVVFSIVLQPNGMRMNKDYADGVKSSMDFMAYVNSSNPEGNGTLSDNRQQFGVRLQVKNNLNLRANSNPQVIRSDARLAKNVDLRTNHQFNISQIGPLVEHIYELDNDGPTDILGVEIFILWPTRMRIGDKYLLYLIEKPIINGPGVSCQPMTRFNPEKLLLEGGEQVDVEPPKSTESSDVVEDSDEVVELRKRSGCSPTVCDVLRCWVDRISSSSSHANRVTFKLRARLWAASTSNVNSKNVQISSLMTVRHRPFLAVSNANKKDHDKDTTIETKLAQATSKLDVINAFSIKQINIIPLWQFVVSAAAGAAFLPLLFFVLWKLGFFKRNRPPFDELKEEERRRLQKPGVQEGPGGLSWEDFIDDSDVFEDGDQFGGESYIQGMQSNIKSEHDANA